MARNILDELLDIDPTIIPVIEDGNVIITHAPPGMPMLRKETPIDPIVVADPHPHSPADDDMAFARKKMRNIIKAAEDAFNELAEIAQETQQPRAYEVLATLLKTATEASKELVGTHKTKAEIRRIELGRGPITAYDAEQQGHSSNNTMTQVNQTIEQAVFVGTAVEMLEMLDKKRPKLLEADIVIENGTNTQP